MLRIYFKIYLVGCTALVIIFIMFAISQIIDDDSKQRMYHNKWPESIYLDGGRDSSYMFNQSKFHVKEPIILWWTKFTGEKGRVKSCPVYDGTRVADTRKCFFTEDKDFQYHVNTKLFMFYGTDFMQERIPDTLPLPRLPQHEWALLHEESPKNNFLFSHYEVLSLFNHTATFRRYSDFPLMLQHLTSIKDIESKKYFIPVEEKSAHINKGGQGLVAYVHSDCDTPSGRDDYVRELMKYVKVDSLGKCVHNKDLPHSLRDPVDGMGASEFYEILSSYKFVLSFENAVCDDYITEKLWRALIVAAVPIYYGSPTVQDWLPTTHTTILATQFSNVSALATYLQYLDSNNEEYNKYMQHKHTGVTNQKLLDAMASRRWGINNDFERGNFIEHFECFLCNRIHQSLERVNRGLNPVSHRASVRDYGCPEPRPILTSISGNRDSINWEYLWKKAKVEAIIIKDLIEQNDSFTWSEYRTLTDEYIKKIGLL